MELVEESGSRLVAKHRAGWGARVAVAVLLFIALSTLVGPVVLVVAAVRAPRTKVIACERQSGQCQTTNLWGGAERPFPDKHLAEMVSYRVSKHRAVLAYMSQGRPFRESGEVSDPDEIAALDAAVARLHAYLSSGEPSVRVEVPNGSPAPALPVLLFMALFGLFNLHLARRQFTSMELVADRSQGTIDVVQGHFLGRRRRTVSMPAVSAVLTANTRKSRSAFSPSVQVALQTSEAQPEVLLFEYVTPRAQAAGRELADRLGAFLGVPVEGD